MDKNFVIIDDIPVEINGEKNLLELINKINIQLPTFCYHSELSIYGAVVSVWLKMNGADWMRLAQPLQNPEW